MAKSFCSIGPDRVCNELVNVRVEHADSVYRSYEPTRNAVIVELVPDRNKVAINGRYLKRIITIECQDPSLLPFLKREAEFLLRTLEDW